jgi:formate dehydrogenase assembly factor FdhD
MKVNYTTASGRLSVELEGKTQKDIFSGLASFQEVFEETSCGKCRSESIKYMVRTVDKYTYYELRCNDCRAKLIFGQHTENGTLFPKRKDEEGNWNGSNGWVKWNPDTQKEE